MIGNLLFQSKNKKKNKQNYGKEKNDENLSLGEETLKNSDSIAPVVRNKFSSLADYKIKNNIKEMEYKEQEWIDMSPAFKDVTKLPGIPLGHVVMNYGKSDVGKTTMLIEAGAYAQKQGILPVLVLTENKFSWDRAETMGLVKEDCIIFDGVETIEDGVAKIKEIMVQQKNGKFTLRRQIRTGLNFTEENSTPFKSGALKKFLLQWIQSGRYSIHSVDQT